MLQLTNESINMLSAIEQCVNLVNNNEGSIVVGWYKRGDINDKSIVSGRNGNTNSNNNMNNNAEENFQVDAGYVSYHIAQIHESWFSSF